MPEEKPDADNLLSYQPSHRASWRKGWAIVFFVFSILLALFVGLLCSVAVLGMLSDNHLDFVAILVLCPILLTVLAIRYARGYARIAGAIAVIAIATFLLMAGLCAHVHVNI